MATETSWGLKRVWTHSICAVLAGFTIPGFFGEEYVGQGVGGFLVQTICAYTILVILTIFSGAVILGGKTEDPSTDSTDRILIALTGVLIFVRVFLMEV